jgi:hypothetical protein
MQEYSAPFRLDRLRPVLAGVARADPAIVLSMRFTYRKLGLYGKLFTPASACRRRHLPVLAVHGDLRADDRNLRSAVADQP